MEIFLRNSTWERYILEYKLTFQKNIFDSINCLQSKELIAKCSITELKANGWTPLGP